MKHLGIISLCVTTYLVSLVANFPVASYLPRFLPADVTVSGINGSLVHGSVERVSYAQFQSEEVNWQLNYLSLLTLQPAFTVETDYQGVNLSTDVHTGYYFTPPNLTDTLATAALQPLLEQWQLPVDLDGEVSLSLASLALNADACAELAGTVSIGPVRSESLPALNKLKALNGTLSCQRNALVLDIPVNQKALRGSMQVKLTQQGRYQTKIKLRPSDPELRTMLQTFLGKPNRQGQFSFNYTGIMDSEG